MVAAMLYGIAPDQRESEFDSIVDEVARATGVPVAFIGFIDGDREWVKASIGWDVRELPLHASFALRIADARDLVIASDAVADSRVGDHPLVAHAPHIRFYAGVPLFANDGTYVGAISLLDHVPRIITREQAHILRLLGAQVMRELAIRHERKNLEEEVVRAQEMLDESDARFRDFFEQTDDLVMSIGADGRLLHSNEAVVSVLGFSREELTRAPLLRVVDAESRDSFREAFAAAFETGEPQRVETTFVTAGGRRITVEGSLRPRVIDGKALLARVIFRDITDRKQFESELGSARDAALEAARLKTQFLTNVSHEIRTPMNGIVGMTDLLLATTMSEEQRDFALQARASAEQLLSIVNNILYVSNIEAGALGGANIDFDLYRTLQRVVEV